MPNTQNRAGTDEVACWVEKKAGIGVLARRELAKDEDEYLYLPVHVDGKGPFEIAKLLQKIEDEWNDTEPEKLPRLLLIPTKD
jgi:hypothetical protein